MTMPAATVKKPGPSLVLSIVIMVIGTIIGIGGLSTGIDKVVHDVKEIGSGITPTTFHHQLDTGTWEIYAEEGAAGVQPGDVTVTGPGGISVPTRGPGSASENQTRGGTRYRGAVQFTVTVAGDYTVRVRGDAGDPVILTKSFGEIARHAAIWFVGMGVGFLIGVIGLVLLIVGISRRRSARRPSQPAYGGFPGWAPPGTPAQPSGVYQPAATGSAPPGWYQDNDRPGLDRWWDGVRWTDQTHPRQH